MPELAEQLERARAEVRRLERLAAVATCDEIGHDWHHAGGCNAGCHERCSCSVPVHKCTRCGDYDYGNNQEAAVVRDECAFMYGPPSERFAPLPKADHDLAYTDPRSYNQFI